MTEIFKVALAGLGTVGGGVVKLLREQSVLLEKRTGVKIVLAAVSDLNPQKFLELGLPGEVFQRRAGNGAQSRRRSDR